MLGFRFFLGFYNIPFAFLQKKNIESMDDIFTCMYPKNPKNKVLLGDDGGLHDP